MADDGAMYIITNREVFEKKSGFDKFGKKPNGKGGLELRVVKVRKQKRTWLIDVQKDTVERKAPKRRNDDKAAKPGAETIVEPYSKVAARVIFNRLTKSQGRGRRPKSLLLFVHGFNNDMESIVERAWALQKTYGTEVVAFSWPANGGGAKGVVSYKSDKRDALASVGALDRVLERLDLYFREFRSEQVKKLRTLARAQSNGSREAEAEIFAELCEKDCPVRMNLMCHSMGNYLLKHLLGSSTYNGTRLIFDNVSLVAADANNLDHRRWVDRLEVRNRVYVTINEKDSALRVSRMKMGDEQLARLGHYPYNLESNQTVYVDFTAAESVGSSHAYFEGKPTQNNQVKSFFRQALRGEVAEDELAYDAARNLYRIVDS